MTRHFKDFSNYISHLVCMFSSRISKGQSADDAVNYIYYVAKCLAFSICSLNGKFLQISFSFAKFVTEAQVWLISVCLLTKGFVTLTGTSFDQSGVCVLIGGSVIFTGARLLIGACCLSFGRCLCVDWCFCYLQVPVY